MLRLEPVLVAFFMATWVVDFLAVAGVVELRGSLELGFYPLYSLAASSGWLAGHVYMARGRDLPPAIRRRVLLVYFLGPPGLLYLVRAMASAESHRAAPLVPLYSFGVFTVFFLVPVLLPVETPRRRPRARGPDDGEDGDPPVVP